MLHLGVITLLPEMLQALNYGIVGRSIKQGLVAINSWNPREWSRGVHHQIDDKPYGGGPGMVMMAEPLSRALAEIRTARAPESQAPVVLLSPVGKPFDQAQASRLAQSTGAIFICGRYEGVDQRLINQQVDEQWSLGDFVLSGGEIAAMAMIDAAVRLIPGTLNHNESSAQDSFQESLSGLLDSPHYTRPESLNGETVPAVLLSGHHANIARWRRERSLALTLEKRPDLLEQARKRGQLTPADESYLLGLTKI